MSSDINVVTLVGRLTRDIEVKATKDGTPVGEIGLAVNGRKKTGEDWTDEVSFFDVTLFGKRAVSLAPYLLKGTTIAMQGSLRQNRWTTQEGKNRSRVGIRISDIQLLSSIKQQAPAPEESSRAADFDDDILF